MTPDVKHDWVEALRSGRFVQGFERLRPSRDTYCCLGVLCEVLGFASVQEDIGFAFAYRIAGVLHFGSPPTDAVGLDAKDITKLLRWNDITKASFPKIADWIEKNIVATAPLPPPAAAIETPPEREKVDA